MCKLNDWVGGLLGGREDRIEIKAYLSPTQLDLELGLCLAKVNIHEVRMRV